MPERSANRTGEKDNGWQSGGGGRYEDDGVTAGVPDSGELRGVGNVVRDSLDVMELAAITLGELVGAAVAPGVVVEKSVTAEVPISAGARVAVWVAVLEGLPVIVLELEDVLKDVRDNVAEGEADPAADKLARGELDSAAVAVTVGVTDVADVTDSAGVIVSAGDVVMPGVSVSAGVSVAAGEDVISGDAEAAGVVLAASVDDTVHSAVCVSADDVVTVGDAVIERVDPDDAVPEEENEGSPDVDRAGVLDNDATEVAVVDAVLVAVETAEAVPVAIEEGDIAGLADKRVPAGVRDAVREKVGEALGAADELVVVLGETVDVLVKLSEAAGERVKEELGVGDMVQLPTSVSFLTRWLFLSAIHTPENESVTTPYG